MKTIWFDMDGTIADLYGVSGWLGYIQEQSVKPYLDAKPLVNLSTLAYYLNKLQGYGYKIGIISWTAKNGNQKYNLGVQKAKEKWLKVHLASVKWDFLKIVEYGTNKYETCGNGILFDDEKQNRETWKDESYEPQEIMKVLKYLLAK